MPVNFIILVVFAKLSILCKWCKLIWSECLWCIQRNHWCQIVQVQINSLCPWTMCKSFPSSSFADWHHLTCDRTDLKNKYLYKPKLIVSECLCCLHTHFNLVLHVAWAHVGTKIVPIHSKWASEDHFSHYAGNVLKLSGNARFTNRTKAWLWTLNSKVLTSGGRR